MTYPQGEQAEFILDQAAGTELEPETCEECDELLEDCSCEEAEDD